MTEIWGAAPDGSPVLRLRLAAHGLQAQVISFGAGLQDLRLEGRAEALVLGYPKFAPYVDNPAYLGASVGRYAGRISGAAAVFDGARRLLDANFLGAHHLHGGRSGSTFRNWTLADAGLDFAVFTDTLPDGHMGFPGALSVSAAYRVAPGPALEVTFEATTDAPTLCNFTHHSYFNLDGSRDLTHHWLSIDADSHIPLGPDGLPTANAPHPVTGALDFQRLRSLGGVDLDHAFRLSDASGSVRPVARLVSVKSGVEMRVETTEPGLQVYTGGGLPRNGPPGLNGRRNGPFAGLALEPQVWPDAPNQPSFPSAALAPGETYRHQTRYVFAQGLF